jgi:hypothetical protein
MFNVVVLTTDENLRHVLLDVAHRSSQPCEVSVLSAQDIIDGNSVPSNTDLLVVDCEETSKPNLHVFDIGAAIDALKMIFIRNRDARDAAPTAWLLDHFEIDKPVNAGLLEYVFGESIADCALNRARRDFVESLIGVPTSQKN